MNRTHPIAIFLAAAVAFQVTAPSLRAETNDTPLRTVRARVPRIVDRFVARSADGSKAPSPEWVERALQAGLQQIASRPHSFGISDPHSELRLTSAVRDDEGVVDLRLAQLYGGLEVYGGQLIPHMDRTGGLKSLGGHAFDVAGSPTTPQIDEERAIYIASASLADATGLAATTRLVLAPNALITDNDRNRGARLAFQVSFKGRGTQMTRNHEVFVDALSGAIVWSFAATPCASGIGWGEHSGRSTIITTEFADNNYAMIDPLAGGSSVLDANDVESAEGILFIDSPDNVWGDGTPADRQTAAVDANVAIRESWQYFFERHGRFGADGIGTPITTYVHFGSAYNNASGGENVICVGDGDGTTRRSFAALDVMGHEFTHCVVDATANLPYSGETGAVDEAMSDIFGAAIEFRSGANPDYLIGEDIVIGGGSFRDMANPNIDHMSEKAFATGCTPQFGPDGKPTNDYCGVHSNSGIVNKAFHLIAEGGTHPDSEISVNGIGREAAEDIFYVALSRYMFTGSNFSRTAYSTLSAATDLYGYNSAQYLEVKQGWLAVGVLQPEDPAADPTEWKTLFYASYDGSAQTGRINEIYEHHNLVSYSVDSFSTDWSSVVRLGSDIFYYNRDTGLAALGYVDWSGNHVTSFVFEPDFFGPGYTHIAVVGGNVFFYKQGEGVGMWGRFGGPNGFRAWGIMTGFSFWTEVIGAQGRLFFYNSQNGISAACVFDEYYEGTSGMFRELVDIRLRQISTQQLSAGWSHVLETKDGILFYNTSSGAYRMGDLNSSGSLITRTSPLRPSGRPYWTYSNLGPQWTHVERVKDNVLFYDTNRGTGMVASLFKPGTGPYAVTNGEPIVRREHPAMFPGWTHVVGTIDPTVVH